MSSETSKAAGRPWEARYVERTGHHAIYPAGCTERVADCYGTFADAGHASAAAVNAALIVERVNGWEALVAERDRAVKANAEATYKAKVSDSIAERAIAERDALKAERDRLREALRAILARTNGEFDAPELVAYGPLLSMTTDDVRFIARAALEGRGR